MFQLYDRTRRRIALAALVVLALLPTVIVLAYGVAWRLPQHVQAEAERLGDRIGMKVSMRAIRHLRPGLVRYEGLELLNPETGRPVLRCGTLQAGWDQIADDQGRQQAVLLLSAADAEIDTAQAEQLWRLADRLFWGGPTGRSKFGSSAATCTCSWGRTARRCFSRSWPSRPTRRGPGRN